MRRSVRCCLHLAVSMIVLWPAFGQQTKPLSLDALITEALKNNPQLRAARSQSAAVRARVGQSTSWEDLQIGVEFFQTPISSFPFRSIGAGCTSGDSIRPQTSRAGLACPR